MVATVPVMLVDEETSTAKGDSEARVRDECAELRAQGPRPCEISVPAIETPVFATEAHRQSRGVADSPHGLVDQALIDAISIWPDGCRVWTD